MKKNYYENQILYQIKQKNYDFLDLHLDSTYITKKTIKSIFDALWFEIDENKVVFVIKKFTALSNSDIKFLMKLETKMLVSFLSSYAITDHTFDTILQFYLLNAKKIKNCNVVKTNMDFYKKNFYNYYIAKKINDAYNFDIEINEHYINENMYELFIDLYSKISIYNLDLQKIDEYFASFEDKRLVDNLYKKRNEDRNKQNKTTAIKVQNYQDLKKYLCYKNKKHVVCSSCKNIVETTYENIAYENIAQTEYEKAIQKENFDRTYYLITHTKSLHTIKNLKLLLNKYFRANCTKPLLILLSNFIIDNCHEIESYFCNLYRELAQNVLIGDNDNQFLKVIQLIISLKPTNRLFACIMCYLYCNDIEKTNKYIKLQVKAYIHKNYNHFTGCEGEIISEMIETYLKDEIIYPDLFKPMSKLLNIDNDKFIVKNAYYMANKISLSILCQYFDKYKYEIMPFVVVKYIQSNLKFDNAVFFDFEHDKIRNKHSCLIIILLMLDNYDLKMLENSFLEIKFRYYLQSNLDQFIFLLKKVYMKQMFKYTRCIFEVFYIIFDELEEHGSGWINQIYPYFVFFYEKYTDKTTYCENKDTDKCCLQKFVSKFAQKVKIDKTIKRYPLLDLETNIDNLEHQDMINLANSISKIKNTNLLPVIITKLDCIFAKIVNTQDNENINLMSIIDTLQSNYKNNVEIYKFRAKHAIYDCNERAKTNEYYFIDNFSVESASIFILEHFLVNVDVEYQDLYFCATQEIFKNIENKNVLKKAIMETSQQFAQTKFQFQITKETKPDRIYEVGYSYTTFLTNLLNNCLYLLQKNSYKEYDILRFGKHFDTKGKEIYTLVSLKVLGKDIDFDFNTLVLENNIRHCNHKILLFGLKASMFSNIDYFTHQNNILVCIKTKEYYYLLKKIEFGAVDENTLDLLQYLYYRIHNFENCKAISARNSLMDVNSLFYDLCIGKDYQAAKNLVFDNMNEKKTQLYLQDCIDDFDALCNFDINEIFVNINNAEDYLNKWIDTNNEELKLNIFHLHYDTKLFTTCKNKIDTLQQIERRRQKLHNKAFILNKHEEFVLHIKKQHKQELVNTEELSNATKQYETNIIYEKTKIYRKENNYPKSKILINDLIKNKDIRAFYEKAKILAKSNQNQNAVEILKKSLMYINTEDAMYEKFYVLYAKLANTKICFQEACEKISNSESLYYFKGKFYENTDRIEALEAFLKCFKYRNKYTHILIAKIIFFLTENPTENNNAKLNNYYKNACLLFSKTLSNDDYEEFIENFNDIVPKIIHKNAVVAETMVLLLNAMYRKHPQKSFWLSLIIYNSKQKEQQNVLKKILNNLCLDLKVIFQNIFVLSQTFLKICDYKTKGNDLQLSIQKHFKLSLTYTEDVCIPNSKFNTKIAGFLDHIQVYKSLQSPKKITLTGTNGKLYCLLCKPNDDLRKDNRFMDLNRTLNNIFKKDKKTSQKNLYIRTYTVIPINHKNGIIEWVDGLQSLKSICEHEYNIMDKSIHDIQGNFKTSKKIGPKKFKEVCKMYPPVLYKFFDNKKDPYLHYVMRQRFIKTFAVMNTVGWFMGLGDRHLENIMIDATTGDTFHVDLNSIFENAKLLSVPERVPFRLTQNIIHAFGPLGIDGTYKNTMIDCLNAMIQNKDLILSNLLLFIYDPLHEWNNSKKNIEDIINNVINRQIKKLSGEDVKMCVEDLIQVAIDHDNLANMYIGWCSYI
ncbi:serine/threonine-protein kinase M1 [Binucleata daphniae]